MSAPVIHPERAAAYARGDLAERMVGVACALACEVRDEGAEAVAGFLATLSAAEKDALLVVAAAMIPVDTAPADLLAWVTWDEFGAPLPGTQPAAPVAREAVPDGFYEDCGTPAAYWRHKLAGHRRDQIEACGCAQAGRDYYVARYAARVGQVQERAPKSRRDERAERYAELRRLGVSRANAAAELKVSLRTTYRYDARLKEARDAA